MSTPDPSVRHVYVVIRRDLSPAQRAVQGIHAAVEAVRRFPGTFDPHPHVVLCEVEDEAALNEVGARLERCGIAVTPFWEPDLGDALTAVATNPLPASCRRHFRRLPLYAGASP